MTHLGPIPLPGSALSFASGLWRQLRSLEETLRTQPRLWRLALLILLVAVLANDLPARSGDWLRSGTDMAQVLPSLRSAGFDDLKSWVTGPWIGKVIERRGDPFLYYRPVTSALWLAQYRLFGENVVWWQNVSIALHLATVLLVAGLCRQLAGGAALPALVGAAVWATRDRIVDTLEWTPAQTDHFAAFLGILALWLLGNGSERQGGVRWLCLLASAPTAVLAMGSKEIALTIPPLALVLAALAPGRTLRFRIGVAGSALGLLGAFFLWRTHALGGLGFVPGAPGSESAAPPTLWSRAVRVGAYLVPQPLSAQALVPFGAVAALYATLAGIASFYDRRSRLVATGVGFVVVSTLLGDPIQWFLPNETNALLEGLVALWLAGQALRRGRDSLRFLAWGAIAHAPLYHVVFNSAGYVTYLPETYWALVWTALSAAALGRKETL